VNSEKIKSEIIKRVTEKAERRRHDAAMQGSMGDNGAALSVGKLEYWVDGIFFAQTGKTEKYKDLVQEIKNDADPEYHEYLRLKEKFEK
tara:strand:- start:355 stop:621 length:267 start_codon:yes stop_codon:yes gene_type:complete